MTSSTDSERVTSLNEPIHELCDNVSSKTTKVELCDEQCIETVINEIENKSVVDKNFLQSRENTMSDKIDPVESVLELFPFICGICEEKFNQVPQYFAHIETHESVDNLLHCRNENGDGLSVLFRCSLCDLKFPSLCMIYRHVVTVENLRDFMYKSSNRTIYAFTPNDEESYGVSTHDKEEVHRVIENEDNFGVSSHDKDKDQLHRAIENEDNFGEIVNFDNDHEEEIDIVFGNEDSFGINLDDNHDIHRVMEKEIKVEKHNIIEQNCDSVQGSVRRPKKREKNVHRQVNKRTVQLVTTDDLSIEKNKSSRKRSGLIEASSTSMETKQRPTNKQNELFPCEVCGGFYKYANLKKHRTIHDERTHTCDQCHRVYKSQFRLNSHKKQVHIEEKRYTCEECGKSFKAAQYLRQHRQVHVKECNIQCVECTMKFRYKALLKAHMRTHSEVKPFQCNQCERTFKQAHELRFHTNSFHTDERTFACTECNKMFKTFKHMKQHHWIHLPPRYFCPVCGKGFIQKANMRLHVKIHGIQV